MTHIKKIDEMKMNGVNVSENILIDTFYGLAQVNKKNILANGNDDKFDCGFFHCWYLDAPAANFAGTNANVFWEIIGCNSVNELGLLDEYEDDDDALKEMKKFLVELGDLPTTKILFHPFSDSEYFIRIW